jgi:transcriptional regulator with XRE-family HTH domain
MPAPKAAASRQPRTAGGSSTGARRAEQVVAGNIRRLRKARNVSLSELARASDVAKATLSLLETGKGNPTVQTLSALADALGCSLGDLLAENSPQILRDGEGTWVEDDAVHGRLLARLVAQRGVDVHEVIFHHGKRHQAMPLAGTIEHVYVVSGALRAQSEDTDVELAPGDMMRFPSDLAYSLEALRGDTRALLFINAADGGPRSVVSSRSRRPRAAAPN